MDIDVHDKKRIGTKQFETYTGLALLDAQGDVVHRSMFKDSVKVGVGNTFQVKWNIIIE